MQEAVQRWIADPASPVAWMLGAMVMGVFLALVRAFATDLRNPGNLAASGPHGVRSLHVDQLPKETTPSLQSEARLIALAIGRENTASGSEPIDPAPAGCRRHLVRIDVPYGRDFTLAMTLMEQNCRVHPGVLDRPALDVRVAGLSDSGIELIATVWASTTEPDTFAETLRTSIQDTLTQRGQA